MCIVWRIFERTESGVCATPSWKLEAVVRWHSIPSIGQHGRRQLQKSTLIGAHGPAIRPRLVKNLSAYMTGKAFGWNAVRRDVDTATADAEEVASLFPGPGRISLPFDFLQTRRKGFRSFDRFQVGSTKCKVSKKNNTVTAVFPFFLKFPEISLKWVLYHAIFF
jgi:hypothetical protein